MQTRQCEDTYNTKDEEMQLTQTATRSGAGQCRYTGEDTEDNVFTFSKLCCYVQHMACLQSARELCDDSPGRVQILVGLLCFSPGSQCPLALQLGNVSLALDSVLGQAGCLLRSQQAGLDLLQALPVYNRVVQLPSASWQCQEGKEHMT